MFPVNNPARGKHILFIGQSWIDMLREKSGGAYLMNLLTTALYFSTGYGRDVLCGQGGIATLKRNAPTNLLTSGVKYGYLWDEDSDLPGPILTGQVSVSGTPTTITTAANALAYWFTTSGFLTPTDIATITDCVLMQGQGDEVGATIVADATLWKESHKKVLTHCRTAINPSSPNSVRGWVEQIGRRPSGSDAGAQTIREMKLQLVAEMTNVQMICEVYDLELLYQTDPTKAGDVHFTDRGSLDFGARIAQALTNTSRKLGPSVSSIALGAANRVDIAITVESGETLVKPAAPYGIRIEVNGAAVTPTAWAWSVNTLQATLPSAPATGDTIKVYPIYGVMSGFSEETCIRYVAATSSSHPYYGLLNLPLRSGLPLTIIA